jgi:hypothetical protein
MEKEKSVIKQKQFPLAVFIIGIAIVITLLSSICCLTVVQGERRWATYTGVIVEFDIDCDQCCHPSSYFWINTSDGVVEELVGNCDANLENIVHVGEVYTIRIEPYAEPYAIYGGFGEPTGWWAVKIDWVKDSNGNVIYGSEWW